MAQDALLTGMDGESQTFSSVLYIVGYKVTGKQTQVISLFLSRSSL